MIQADIDARFLRLCTEIDATIHGRHGTITPQHIIAFRDRLARPITIAARDNARGKALTSNQVDELCDLFTDITGIDIP